MIYLDDVDFLSTPHHQKCASDFVSSKQKSIQGVGLSFSCPFVWQKLPLLYTTARDLVTKDETDRYSRLLYEAAVFNCDLSKVNEKKQSDKMSVQSDHLDELARMMPFIMTTTTAKSSLEKQNCKDGVVSEDSDADAYIVDRQKNTFGIVDVKHGTDCPEEALRQAFSSSTNVALSLINRGITWEDICVPIFVSTGHLVQFALTCVLQPSFPYMITLTKNLDLLNANDRLEAAKQLQIINKLSQHNLTTNCTLHHTLKISRRYYHLKTAEDIFKTRRSFDKSLFHMFSLLESLYHESTRQFVLFPLTYRTGSKSFAGGALVFPKLSEHRIGLPEDAELRGRLLGEFRKAAVAFHDRNVVHMDFYPSNLMWKVNGNGTLDVKVIDWDAAHELNEALQSYTLERLSETNRYKLCNNPHTAISNLDLVFLDILEYNQENLLLCSREKSTLDKTFKSLCESFNLDESLGDLKIGIN